MGKNGKDKIYRRDFINGMMIAAGTAAVGGSVPMRAFGAGTTFPCDGPIGSDPNVLRGGNLPSVFNIAHWLRDNRLTFKTNSVLISSSPCDNFQGNVPLLADNGNYEVIIVGAGMSGCSAAFYLTRQRPGTKILILDGQRMPGRRFQTSLPQPQRMPCSPTRRSSMISTTRQESSGRTMWCPPRSTAITLTG